MRELLSIHQGRRYYLALAGIVTMFIICAVLITTSIYVRTNEAGGVSLSKLIEKASGIVK